MALIRVFVKSEAADEPEDSFDEDGRQFGDRRQGHNERRLRLDEPSSIMEGTLQITIAIQLRTQYMSHLLLA